MNLDEFIISLRNSGIELRTNKGRLICNAPRGAMTDAMRREILDLKPKIIEFIENAQSSDNSIGRLPVPQKPPLSFSQQRMWYLDQFEPNSILSNLPSAFRLNGSLSVEAFKTALHEIAKRHESIRTTFSWDSDSPYQIISPEFNFDLLFTDLSLQPDSRREDDLIVLLENDARQPFNLSNGPLLRARLIKLNESEHVFFFMPHHIIWDGWSFDIFLKELDTLYCSALDGKPPALPELPVSYRDYAVWQRQMLRDHDVEKQLDYWCRNLGGELPPLQMPEDHARPPMMNYTGGRQMLQLDSHLTDALTRLAHSEGATLYMLLLAAFKTILYRYTLQEDIIVGSPIQGRIRPEVENLIGFFVNTLVLRTSLTGFPSFRELLSRVKETCLNAYSHQDIPFERLVETLKPIRDLSRTPIFQAMFTYQDVSGRSYKIDGISMSQIEINNLESPTDVHFFVKVSSNNIIGGFEYCKSLFDDDTITRFKDNFHVLLKSIASDCGIGIDHLCVLTEKEKVLMLKTWNVTGAAYPESSCLQHLIEKQARRNPEKTAVVFGSQHLSYRELNERANQLAHFLVGEGIGPDTFVGICFERSIEMVIAVLGVVKAGGAYLPLDPNYPAARLSYMLEDSQAPVLLCRSSLLKDLPPLTLKTICLDTDRDAITRHGTENPVIQNLRPHHLAYIIYTSGSTGKPKGVQVPHGAVVNFLTSMAREPGLCSDDVLLAVTTLSFDIHVLEIFGPLTVGARVVIADREAVSDGSRLVQLIQKHTVTIMQATPGTWRLLLAAGWRGSPQLKVLCGGEAFPRDLLKQLLPRAGSVWNMYGPTETTVWSSCCRMTDAEAPILIGKPIANTKIYILDRLMQPVPVGVSGELCIGGDSVTRGYLNRPELTAKQFTADPFSFDPEARLYKTGDLARYRPDGSIECLGRIDSQVKVRGFRIELGEIESVLSEHAAVQKCVAAVREDQPGDVRLVGYIVPEAGTEVDSAQLRAHLRARLPDYMVPQHFVELAEFPLTPAGKVDRKHLPAPDHIYAHNTAVHVAPRDALELQLTKLWEKTLHVNPISVNDNFFDIGGHSLLAVQLFAEIEKAIGIKLPLATLFQAPSISDLAANIRHNDWKPNWSSLVAIQPGGAKPPLFLAHGGGGNVLLYRDLARHLGADQPVYGLQCLGLDGKQSFLTTIEEMAAHYITEIRSLQPDGPYYLGGYCLGGQIAYEMAQQLTQQGQEVAFVGMLDTQRQWLSEATLALRIHHQYQKIAFHLNNFFMVDYDGKAAFIKEKLAESRRRILRRFQVVKSILDYKLGIRADRPLAIMEQINDKASLEYIAKPYPGHITLFRPKTEYAGYNDPMYGWGNGLTGGVDVHNLSMYPAGMLIEPFVSELAKELKACLSKARSQQPPASA